MSNGYLLSNKPWYQSRTGAKNILDICKKLQDQIFWPKILHTKSAYIVTIFTKKETA